jgi:hypothetical protein
MRDPGKMALSKGLHRYPEVGGLPRHLVGASSRTGTLAFFHHPYARAA